MKAIIWDLNGTIIDDMMVHHRAWQKHLQTLGLSLTLEEVREKIHGVNIEILERLFGDKYSHDERIRISNEKEVAYRQIYEPALIPGLESFFDELRAAADDLPMALATAAPIENVDFVLDKLQLRPLFPTVLHAGSVSKGKPDPEIFLKAAAALNVSPEHAVVFEDSPTGALAASRAGCAVIVVTTTHQPHEFQHVDRVKGFIPDYTDMTVEKLKKMIT